MEGLKVHPDAAIFPMMSDEELAELAEDIKTNGLIHPIVTGNYEGEEHLIDGRNRLRACQLADVKPTFRKLNGEDQKAFILSVNVNRRHMTASQRAMAVAMLHPVGKPRSRNSPTGSDTLAVLKVARSMLQYARAVLANAPDLAKAVMAGNMALTAAFEQAGQRDGILANERSRLRKLRELRPDLAEAVESEEIKLAEAEAQAKADADALKQRRWAATVNLADGLKLLDREPETAAEIFAEFDSSIVEQRGESVTPARLRRAASFLSTFADILEQNQ